MSETTSRAPASRGRGSGRGGRGGFAGRGGRRANGDKSDSKSTEESFGAFDDDGELAELRKKYGDKTGVIREMFPDWSEVDVLFALQETNGDQTEAVTKIAEGAISQWGEVSKTKKTPKPKAKDTPTVATTEQATSTSRASRGGRTVSEGGRGRGRATERGGRGGTRGRTAQPATGGPRNKENEQLSVPTEESSAWNTDAAKIESQPAVAPAVEATPVEAPKPAAPAAKTWASMLRQSTVPKPPVQKEAPRPQPTEPTEVPTPTPAESNPTAPEAETTPVAQPAVAIIEEPALPPPQDDLTKTNLAQVVDDSQPAATGTAASTAADSWDPRQSPISSNATPISAAHQQHQTQRAPISGYAASAIKATTERANRTPSYQRRVLDQEEAVRMPGNREVDRAAVQFGAFNLNGGDEDVDGEREDAETRTQPPADSPVSHPRASLPPAHQAVAVPDSFSQQKSAATGAPPGINPPAGASAGTPSAAQATQAAAPNAQQYGRFGQTGSQDVQKPLDPFSQQAPVSQPPFDNINPATSQPPAHGAFSSAPGDYSNYYTANQQDRNPYNYYGQQYGQQQGIHGHHDGAPSQQRPVGGYNAAQADSLSQYPQSGAGHSQPRFGASADSQNSGQSTPNPTNQAQQQQGQAAPGSQPQGHGQQYPGYNHPYYPYYHQYYSGYGQGGFGPYGGKGGMYGQPYGVSPNAPYDQHSSQGNFGPSTLHRDNSLGSGLGDYGRSGSAQTTGQPGLGGSGFSGSHDSFQRGNSFQSQGQSYNAQSQAGAGGADDLKPFGDKASSGPSPSLGGARPGSATNNVPGQASGLPPPQGGAYGGYPSHLQQGHGAHGSGAYGMGGAGGASQHGNAPYGSYGQSFGSGGGYYGGAGGQQRGGWGGNYH